MKAFKRMGYLTLGFLFFGAPFQVAAGAQLSMTLEDCLRLAQEKNYNLRSAAQQVELTQAKKEEAQAGFFPTLTLTGNYTYLGREPRAQIPVIPPLSPVARPITIGFHDNWDFKMGLSYTVFSWGRVGNSVAAADYAWQAAQKDAERNWHSVRLDVTRTFWSVLLAQELVRVRSEAQKSLKRHQEQVAARLTAGQASRFDLLRAKVEEANALPPLLAAQHQVESGLDLLKNLLGLPPESDVTLPGELAEESLSVDLSTAVATALQKRPELQALALQKEMARKNRATAGAGLRPNLLGSAAFDYKNPFNAQKVWKTDWNFSAAIVFPLFDGLATRARIQQAEVAAKQVSIADEQLRQTIVLEVREAVRAIEEAQKNSATQRENVKLAKESLEIAKVQYQHGLVTNLEALDAELAVLVAQSNYLSALFNFKVAKAQYEQAVGW